MSAKARALPSMAGISPPSTSTTILSMPQPANAPIICSTVHKEIPLHSSPKLVFIRVATTLRHKAGVLLPSAIKTIPVPAAAACIVKVILLPVCRPLPFVLVVCSIVCWHTPTPLVPSCITSLPVIIRAPRFAFIMRPSCLSRCPSFLCPSVLR